jgi:hypothetical protein
LLLIVIKSFSPSLKLPPATHSPCFPIVIIIYLALIVILVNKPKPFRFCFETTLTLIPIVYKHLTARTHSHSPNHPHPKSCPYIFCSWFIFCLNILSISSLFPCLWLSYTTFLTLSYCLNNPTLVILFSNCPSPQPQKGYKHTHPPHTHIPYMYHCHFTYDFPHLVLPFLNQHR